MVSAMSPDRDNAARRLHAIKATHTCAWGIFAGCIVAFPVLAARGQFGLASILVAIVCAEVLVLAVNGMRCPLTAVAARYTSDRADNFDIYLPLWLARYNKRVFGSLFVAGLIFSAWQWLRWTGS
jgi:hypothetical protein